MEAIDKLKSLIDNEWEVVLGIDTIGRYYVSASGVYSSCAYTLQEAIDRVYAIKERRENNNE